ncbi:MAG: HAMP domain-containing histidine kinase [Firmicutes bacterium]|nr:HAMP domain-containing histidine kinase [Bacillota bacterium]
MRDKESFPQQNSTWDLTFAFSALVLLILSGALLLAGAITLILYNSGKLTLDGSHMNIFKLVLVLAGVSLVLGAIFAQIFSKLPLRPFRILISATKRMSKGDFSARIHLSSPILPYEFTQLTESFNAMAEELGNTELLRSDFIHNFSHEFKTPINSLRGFAKLLKNPNLTEEERQEYLDIIISESERLSMLSTNVLNLCKIENQTIAADRQPYDAAEQLRRTLLLLEPKWSKKELDLDPDLPDSLLFNGNQDLLNHLWMNLLDNAIKFSPQGGKLEIRLWQDGGLWFSVRDYGPGMTDEVRAHMFDKFYQGDTSHATEGNGIGLTTVQKIVSLYEGSLQVDSTLGQGSTFTVFLPDAK